MAREDADPDVLWNFEVFRSEEAKAAYENSPLADELRDEIIDLLAEPPMRVAVHPCARHCRVNEGAVQQSRVSDRRDDVAERRPLRFVDAERPAALELREVFAPQ